MDYVRENPPDKPKPSGRPTRYGSVIAEAQKNPGEWLRLKGEHHASNIITLKNHGLTVRSQRGKQKHKLILWVCYQPGSTDPDPADVIKEASRGRTKAS